MPASSEEETKLTPREARQGMITPHMRYVLGFGIALTLVAFLIAWWLFGGA